MKRSIVMLLCLLTAAPAWAQAQGQSASAAPETGVSASARAGHSLGLRVDSEAAGEGGNAEVSSSDSPSPQGPGGGDAGAGQGVQIGVLVGAGFSFDHTVGSVNPLGLGLGVLAGAHLDAFYLGGRAHVYLGDSSELPTGRLSASGWLLAAEVGYEIDLVWVLGLRPGLLLGPAFFSQDGPTRAVPGGYIAGTHDRSRVRLYVSPGATLVLPFGRLSRDLRFLYAGLDVRLGLFFGSTTSAGLESSLIVGVEL